MTGDKINYKYILFDLDGTLTDPKVGITRSVAYGLDKMGIHNVDPETLVKFIGPPLLDSFMEYYGFSEDKAKETIAIQRVYFRETGIFENKLFLGIPELLEELQNSGRTLCIATSKPTVFATQITDYFNLTDYFTHIVGSNLDGTRTAKSEVIAEVISLLDHPDSSSMLMIGDRKHDIIGAKDHGIDTVGVEYGYGDYEELQLAGSNYIVSSVEELRKLF